MVGVFSGPAAISFSLSGTVRVQCEAAHLLGVTTSTIRRHVIAWRLCRRPEARMTREDLGLLLELPMPVRMLGCRYSIRRGVALWTFVFITRNLSGTKEPDGFFQARRGCLLSQRRLFLSRAGWASDGSERGQVAGSK
jgi:hypothetical protein